MEDIQKTLEKLNLALKQIDNKNIFEKLSSLIIDYETTSKIESHIIKHYINDNVFLQNDFQEIYIFTINNIDKLTPNILNVLLGANKIVGDPAFFKRIQNKYSVLKDIHFIILFESLIKPCFSPKMADDLYLESPVRYLACENNDMINSNETLKNLFTTYVNNYSGSHKITVSKFDIFMIDTSKFLFEIENKLTVQQTKKLLDTKNIDLIELLIDTKKIDITKEICCHVNKTYNKEVSNILSKRFPQIFHWVDEDYCDMVKSKTTENTEELKKLAEYLRFMLNEHDTIIESEHLYFTTSTIILFLFINDLDCVKKSIIKGNEKKFNAIPKQTINRLLTFFPLQQVPLMLEAFISVCIELKIDINEISFK